MSAIRLSQNMEIVTRGAWFYLYVENSGPFAQQAPLAWQKFWSIASSALPKEDIIHCAGLSRIDESKQGMRHFNIRLA